MPEKPTKKKGEKVNIDRLLIAAQGADPYRQLTPEERERLVQTNDQITKFFPAFRPGAKLGSGSGVRPNSFNAWRGTPSNEQSWVGKKLIKTPTTITAGGASLKARPTWYGAETLSTVGGRPRGWRNEPVLMWDKLIRDLVNNERTIPEVLTDAVRSYPTTISGKPFTPKAVVKNPSLQNEWLKSTASRNSVGKQVNYIRTTRPKDL